MSERDLRDLIAFQAAAAALFTTAEDDELQWEQRAESVDAYLHDMLALSQTLIERARHVRQELLAGPQEAAKVTRLRPRAAEPAGPLPLMVSGGKLTSLDVRQAMSRYQGGFTVRELAAVLDAKPAAVKKFVVAMVEGGSVRDTGQRIARTVIYEYVPPPLPPDPTHHPRHRPPEKDPPAMTEILAPRGEPVRVAAQEKLTRRGRSTPGQGHIHRQRDRRYEEAQRVKAQREEARKAKAQKAPKWKRNK